MSRKDKDNIPNGNMDNFRPRNSDRNFAFKSFNQRLLKENISRENFLCPEFL